MISYWWAIGSVAVATFVAVLVGIQFGRLLGSPSESFEDIVEDTERILDRMEARIREKSIFGIYVTEAWAEHLDNGGKLIRRGPVLLKAHGTRREAIDHLVGLFEDAWAQQPYVLSTGGLMFNFRLGRFHDREDFTATSASEFRRHLWELEL